VERSARADGEAAASDPEDPAEIIAEGGCTEQIFNVDETDFFGRRRHLGPSQLERGGQCLADFQLQRTSWLSCEGLTQLVT